MPGGSNCAIFGCSAQRSKCRGLSFHKLPKKGVNDRWRSALIAAINRVDLSFNPDAATICSRHFKESCFVNHTSTMSMVKDVTLSQEVYQHNGCLKIYQLARINFLGTGNAIKREMEEMDGSDIQPSEFIDMDKASGVDLLKSHLVTSRLQKKQKKKKDFIKRKNQCQLEICKEQKKTFQTKKCSKKNSSDNVAIIAKKKA